MKRRIGIAKSLGIAFLIIGIMNNAGHAKDRFPYRLFQHVGAISIHTNQIIGHIKQAADAGYNGMLSQDHNLEKIEEQQQKMQDTYSQVLATAKANGISMIPWHFSQGHGAHENIMLSEAFPVKGTPFVVSGGKARAIPDATLKFMNPGFETGTPVPQHWKAMGPIPSIDTKIKHSGNASVKYTNPTGEGKLAQMVKGLKPFRAYELSVWIRTEGYSHGSVVKFQVLQGGGSLLSNRYYGFGRWGVNGNNRNFTLYKADFNTITNTIVKIELVASSVRGATGSIWFDDVSIREVGLYETLRRDGCPIVVRSSDGSKTYKEGTDYVVDPKCQTFTPQSYYHEGHLTIPAGSAIQNGQQLSVDWYQLANMDTNIPETNFCLPETWTTLQDNLNRIDELFGNSNYMFAHIDEWRVAGWDDRCQKFNFNSGGEYMAQSWSGIECMLRKTGNGCRTVFMWNDMVDPYHNAAGHPVLIKGNDPTRSWEGVGRDVIIVNWNGEYARKSMHFFAGLDPKYPNVNNRQILHDLNAGDASRHIAIVKELDGKGKGNSIVGFSMTDWDGNYRELEAVANAYKAAGYWGTGPMPTTTCAPASECSFVGVEDRKRGSSETVPSHPIRVHTENNRLARISFRQAVGGSAELQIFDTKGRKAQTLRAPFAGPGIRQISWDTAALPAGAYFLRLTVNGTPRTMAKHIIL